MNDIETLKSIDKTLKALLLLGIETREGSVAVANDSIQKIEVLLAQSGFSGQEISTLLNKKADTVKKTLQRSKQNGK